MPKSEKELQALFESKIQKTDSCWLWKGLKYGKKYGLFIVNGKNTYAHRYSYTHFIGSIPTGRYVCHKCDTPLCVNPDHLFIGTAEMNIRDACLKGRMAGNWKTVLSSSQVRQIRRLYAEGNYTQQQLASMFGISQVQISFIITRKARLGISQKSKCQIAGAHRRRQNFIDVRPMITELLRRIGGNKTQAANLIDVSWLTVHYWTQGHPARPKYAQAIQHVLEALDS